MTAEVSFGESELVLVVDDDKACSRTVEEVLASDGMYTVKACSSVEALSVLDTVTPDLILMDTMTAFIDGGGVLGTIRNSGRLRRVPLVMLSAEPTVGQQADAFEAGASGFLAKPFDGDELLAEVGWQLARVSRLAA